MKTTPFKTALFSFTIFLSSHLLLGCSAFTGASGNASNSSTGLSSAAATGTTVLVPSQLNLFSLYQSMVQTTASQKTSLIYGKPQSVLERGNLLPPSGEPSTLNSSQQMVYMLAATEHCNDLIQAEAAIADSAKSGRKFLKTVNLAAGAGLVSGGDFQTAGSALGKSFWRRAVADSELATINELYSELASQGLNNQQMLNILCAVELSSSSSLVH